MIKPLQKLCGMRHEAREPCPAGVCLTPTAAFAESQQRPIYVPVYRGVKKDRVERAPDHPVAIKHKTVVALTPAERAKAYRERHGDAVRKRDRERKARQKSGDE